MQLHYLEVVTRNVEASCSAWSEITQTPFGSPVAMLGNARTAEMEGGGTVGVRAPMSEQEEPVVRPYWLVTNIEAAVEAMVSNGAEVAHPPLEIPGHGTFAILILGGNQLGFWKL